MDSFYSRINEAPYFINDYCMPSFDHKNVDLRNELTPKQMMVHVALKVVKITACVALFCMAPVHFGIGFIVGLIARDHIRLIANKVANFFEKANIPGKALMITGGFLLWPPLLGVSYFILPPFIGSYVAWSADEKSLREGYFDLPPNNL